MRIPYRRRMLLYALSVVTMVMTTVLVIRLDNRRLSGNLVELSQKYRISETVLNIRDPPHHRPEKGPAKAREGIS